MTTHPDNARRLKLIRWLRLAVVILMATFLAPATAETSPMDTVTETVDAVINSLRDDSLGEEARKRQVKAQIASRFDFKQMSKMVLATNWKKASQAQRRRFISLFKELLSNTYWRKISGYHNETVEYLGQKQRNSNKATVNTLIKTSTVDIPVDYKLYQNAAKSWLAYDVVIEQVSLVRNYRGSFQQIVRDDGIDGLLKQLETKVAQSSSAAAP